MKYFTIAELCKSTTADRLGINNRCRQEHVTALTALVDNVLDPCTMLTDSRVLSFIIISVLDLTALCELPQANSRNRHMKGASNICRLTQFITLLYNHIIKSA